METKKIIETVKKYVGYIEKTSNSSLDDFTANKGMNNYTKFARDVNAVGLMGCQGQPWCGTFQFACEIEAYGLEQALKNWNMTKNSYVGYNCFSTYDKFEKNGKISKTPKLGSLVIFTFSHVGRVIEINDQKKIFKTVEGNTSSNTYDRNGGMVAIKTYSFSDSKIKGFCIIDYCEEEQKTFYDAAVNWAIENKVTTENNMESFNPMRKCSRAEGLTFLWRFYGCPEPILEKSMFIDVEEKDYFFKPVMWAYGAEITKGIEEAVFAPHNYITRAEFLVFLWRARKCPKAENKNIFKDVSVNDFFYQAVNWACGEKITTGKSETVFAPYDTCTRAEIVTFLSRIGTN